MVPKGPTGAEAVRAAMKGRHVRAAASGRGAGEAQAAAVATAVRGPGADVARPLVAVLGPTTSEDVPTAQ